MAGLLVERVVATLEGRRKGPTVVITAGLHGNEPAGVHAATRVAAHLADRRWALHGRLVVASGNRAALAAGRRFIHRDLNRRWTDAHLAHVAALPAADRASEDGEQLELAALFQRLAAEAKGPLTFLDLHSTSGASPPFVTIADTLASRALAMELPLPLILGLEEVVDATLAGWLADHGHAGIEIEGGRHDDPATVDQLAAAVWLFLVAAGAIKARDVPDLSAHLRRLREAGRDLPRVVELRYRHPTAPGDGFSMDPGWSSFAPVEAGQVVARDDSGPIRAPEGGRMLMPRYQPQGDDGFFLVREVEPFWLRLSAAIRRIGADHLVPLLPGVQRDPARPGQLVTHPAWTPPRVVEVMHLCGYRREQPDGDRMVFSRRGDRR
jgi:succinylglutamate desuccinylase